MQGKLYTITITIIIIIITNKMASRWYIFIWRAPMQGPLSRPFAKEGHDYTHSHLKQKLHCDSYNVIKSIMVTKATSVTEVTVATRVIRVSKHNRV